MNFRTPAALFISCLIAADPASAEGKATTKAKPAPAQMEAATRLQVFLDRANFGPGKLDGFYGDFTRKALALYRESRGEQPEATAPDSKAAPDVTGLDLASVDPVFVDYIVTPEDLKAVGELPEDRAQQAKLKALPYRDAAEAIAEKFHSDVDFIAQLNEGKTKELKVGDQLRVPNVEPFELAKVEDLKPGSEIKSLAANDDAAESPSEPSNSSSPAVAVAVDTKTNMLTVRAADQIVAAYPVTIGSAETVSPLGEWKVRGVANLPTFRYDEKMLNEGERSNEFQMLPPGPNNPVGVMWIALNKKGIGLHGTSEPDEVGRSASHGCVRLANWDIVRLAAKVKAGVPVSIH